MNLHRIHRETRPVELSHTCEAPPPCEMVRENETAIRRSYPQNGDVVVTREPGSPVRYSIRQFPAKAFVGTSARERALGLARMFAELYGVDAWGREEDAFRLLEAYRPRRVAAALEVCCESRSRDT